jgi:hypothetical protein
MYSNYFDNWEVKPVFLKEYLSIFDGWLGTENLYKLDYVTEKEWGKFNSLIQAIYKQNYKLYLANPELRECHLITDISLIIQSYEEATKKDASRFIKLVIPELECIVSEEWDYTYILWHKNNGAIEKLSPIIASSGLYKFHD